MKYKKNRHAYYKLTYHLVVVTKYRNKCINEGIMNRLKEISRDLFDKWDCEIIEINGEADHMHILFDAQADYNYEFFFDKNLTANLLFNAEGFNDFMIKLIKKDLNIEDERF